MFEFTENENYITTFPLFVVYSTKNICLECLERQTGEIKEYIVDSLNTYLYIFNFKLITDEILNFKLIISEWQTF